MKSRLNDILKELSGLDDNGLLKEKMEAFLKQEAPLRGDAGLEALWNDLFGLMEFLGRSGQVRSPERIPFWEYSVFLGWAENHLLFGDAFDLNLKNARRALGNVRDYYAYLCEERVIADTAAIDRAIVEICSGKKLTLITDIPFEGTETWLETWKGKQRLIFDISEYWLLVLLELTYSNDWQALLAAAPTQEKKDKVEALRMKMKKAAAQDLAGLGSGDIYEHELARAENWFFGRKE